MIVGSYLIVGAVGSTLIGLAVAEKVLITTHRFRGAEFVGNLVGKSLPWAFIIGALWALLHTPFL